MPIAQPAPSGTASLQCPLEVSAGASGRERNKSITLGGFFLDFQGMGYKREELLMSGFTTASKRMPREHGFL